MDFVCHKCGRQFSADMQPDAPEIACSACGATMPNPNAATAKYPSDMKPPSASAAAEEVQLAPGTMLGRFRILELIGRGGMGAVYKAVQTSLNRIVAIKVLPTKLSESADFVARFERESSALASLSHPGIIQIIDRGVHEGAYYFVMEYVDGVSLRTLMSKGKLLPEQALKLVPLVCEALEYAHAQGVVHRDIKPANILLDKQGRVKIADFGLAKLVRGEHPVQGLTQTNMVVGTVNYMSPEQQFDPKRVDHRADIYSLGVVLYEMLTGELPIGRFEPPSQRVQVDVRFDEVVLKALEREPQRRYQRASEMGTQVSRISDLAGPKGAAARGRPDAAAAAPGAQKPQVPPTAPAQEPSAAAAPAGLPTPPPAPPSEVAGQGAASAPAGPVLSRKAARAFKFSVTGLIVTCLLLTGAAGLMDAPFTVAFWVCLAFAIAGILKALNALKEVGMGHGRLQGLGHAFFALAAGVFFTVCTVAVKQRKTVEYKGAVRSVETEAPAGEHGPSTVAREMRQEVRHYTAIPVGLAPVVVLTFAGVMAVFFFWMLLHAALRVSASRGKTGELRQSALWLVWLVMGTLVLAVAGFIFLDVFHVMMLPPQVYAGTSDFTMKFLFSIGLALPALVYFWVVFAPAMGHVAKVGKKWHLGIGDFERAGQTILPGKAGDSSLSLQPGDVLAVRLVGGDVSVEGCDENSVKIEADGSFNTTREGNTILVSAVSSGLGMKVPRGLDVKLATAGGDVSVERVSGGLEVTTASGNIRAEGIAGRLKVQTANGDVEISALSSDDFFIESASGDIEIEELRLKAGTGKATSLVGDITVTYVSGESQFEYRLRSTNGDISDPQGRSKEDGGELSGVIGSAAARLELTSQNGDVELSGK